jgi:hypothetical protein
MGYTDQRDAILVHAKAAALTANPKFTNVVVGAPIPNGKCVRIFWAGEAEPVRMGTPRVLNAEMVAPTIGLVAFWPLTTLTPTAIEAIDDEMSAFIHALRTAVLADSQLGGQATDLEMGYAEPSFVVIEGSRYATVEVPFTLDFLEYPLGA